MYKSPSKVRQASLFWDLETMLSPKNSLYKLANLIDWNLFEQSFAPLYSKGKEGKKYEFGNKVSIVRLWDGLIIGALSFRNEYDGHTIDKVMEQVRRLYDRKIKTLACDRGYRGQSMSGQTQIIIPDTPKKTDSRYAKNKKHKLFRKRAGVEPVIGHCKADHRLGRNFYKGLFGDSINVMLAAAAFNFKRAIRLLLCLIERVIMWCCGRLNLNFQYQFITQVYMKNAMSPF